MPFHARSKSDAMAVLLAGEGHNAKAYSEVGRTDTVANSLSEQMCGWTCRNQRQWGGVANETTEQGRTVLHHSTLPVCAPQADPEFHSPLRAMYNFEKLQPMRLVVYDVDVQEKDNRKLRLAEQASLHGAGGPCLH